VEKNLKNYLQIIFIHLLFFSKEVWKEISQIEKTTFIFGHNICGKKSKKLFANYIIPKQNE